MKISEANVSPGSSSEALDLSGAARFVAVCDRQAFAALVEGALRIAAEAPGTNQVVCVDGHTLSRSFYPLLAQAGRILLFASESEPAASLDHVERRAPVNMPGFDAQFLIICGDSFHFYIHGSMIENAPASEPDCAGAWTTDPREVSAFAARLLGEPDLGPPLSTMVFQAATLRLAAIHAEALSAGRRHIARDKADLSSVLEILKAISTKRRAHDVLYVFVEHIARVCEGIRRCSVVRVWGDQHTGHVLASHEDPALQEYCIDLDKYPELSMALQTGETIEIADVANHPFTMSHAGALRKAKIASLIVIPVVLFDEEIGSLFLRAARSEGEFKPREVGFLQIAAEAASSALERAQLFDNIQRANERLARLAKTDGLTGLYNYRHFRDRVEEEHSRAVRYGLPLSCMIFDVDDFKVINDDFGHVAGDAVIRGIAQRTLGCIRTIDIVARYGGEEFAVIMPQTDLQGAIIEAERLREAVGSEAFSIGDAKSVHVAVSLGIAQLDKDRMKTVDGLVRAADEALYHAKRAGKNQVSVFDPAGKYGSA